MLEKNKSLHHGHVRLRLETGVGWRGYKIYIQAGSWERTDSRSHEADAISFELSVLNKIRFLLNCS